MDTTKIEMQINGTWTDITGDVYARDAISITRGVPDQGTEADPGQCTLTLNNRGGKYSPRNPMSPYYGLIGRNTPVRISMPVETPYLWLDGVAGYASTPDSPDLELSSAIDCRIDMATAWRYQGICNIAGKYFSENGAARTWLWQFNDGASASLAYSDGTKDGVISGFPAHGMLKRQVFRFTWSATPTHTFTYYIGPTMDGPWEELRVVDDASSGTSVALNTTTAPMVIGATSYSDAGVFRPPMRGRVYRMQLRSAVDGTIVSDVDFTQASPGDTSVTDAQGHVWTLYDGAEIRDRVDRFYGEISAWPPQWDPSGNDSWVSVTASGVLRRMGQGEKPLESTLKRRLPSQPDLLAYWPMEDGADATSAASPLPGVKPLQLTNVDWASDDSLPSSAPLPVFNSQGHGGSLPMMQGSVPAPTSTITGWQVCMITKLDTVVTDGPWTYMRVATTGTCKEIWVQAGVTGGNRITRIFGLDGDGNTVFTLDFLTGTDIYGQWETLRVFLQQTNTNTVTWNVYWQDIGGDAGGQSGTYTGTIGHVTDVLSPPGGFASQLDGMAIGHIGVFGVWTTPAYNGAITGYSGETAITRIVRLASEESIPLVALDGDRTVGSVPMGYQAQDTVLNLLAACAASDGGLLCEDVGSLGLIYRDRASMYDQVPALTLDYGAGQVWDAFEPVDDDTAIKNDVTVTRDGGSSYRAVLESGPLSVQAPPNGIGAYSSTSTYNLGNDADAEPLAYWYLYLGTWDEARYPSVTVRLDSVPADLRDAALSVVEGDRITITNLPNWVATDDVDLIVRGYSESISYGESWTITFNCEPGAPWNVGLVEVDDYGRVDTEGSSLTAATDTASTEIAVLSTDGLWTQDAADLPFDIRVGGERMTVTSVTGNATDSFTRTVTGGWGSDDQGHAWTPAVSDTSELAVNGSSGTITLKSNLTTMRYMEVLEGLTDCEVAVTITPSQLPAGGNFAPGVFLRGNGGYYWVPVVIQPSGAVSLLVGNQTTQVGDAAPTGITFTAGTAIRMRARVVGDTVYARAWLASGSEPNGWQLTQAIDGNPWPNGAVGVCAVCTTGATNTSPVFAFDDWTIAAPQTFAVTRSVNGIVKAHDLGTAVSLADPTYIAL